jgi:hypothetical protein
MILSAPYFDTFSGALICQVISSVMSNVFVSTSAVFIVVAGLLPNKKHYLILLSCNNGQGLALVFFLREQRKSKV